MPSHVLGSHSSTLLNPVGQIEYTIPLERGTNAERIHAHGVTDNFFSELGVRAMLGRVLAKGDDHTAVFSYSYWVRSLGRDPHVIGQTLRLKGHPFQIVGVVQDRINRILTNETLPEMYVPYTIMGVADRIMVACQTRPESLERALRAQVYAVDPTQPVMDVFTVEDALARYVYSRPRFNLILFAVFAALGLTLALFGIYGVISNSVAQQTREIGIRIALGASLGEVVGMMLQSGAKLLAIGILVGLAGSLASVKMLSGLVFNVSTFDVWSFLAVTLVLFAAGLFACYWPARRAARIDPVIALRDE